MNHSLIKQLEARLLEQQKTLLGLKEISEDAVKTVELDQTSVGRLSRMDALQGQAMAKEQERRRTIEMQNISSALRRIETGNYGYCIRCEEEIAAKRLEFDPAIPLCISCANKLDDRNS